MYCPVERRSIQQNLERILSRYTSARSSEPIGKEHEVWGIFEELHEEFSELQAVKSEPTLKVSWSAGQGVWAKVPWIAFLDSRETTTTKRGSTASSSSDRMPAGSISPSITGSPTSRPVSEHMKVANSCMKTQTRSKREPQNFHLTAFAWTMRLTCARIQVSARSTLPPQ
jgi:hypothetical protein